MGDTPSLCSPQAWRLSLLGALVLLAMLCRQCAGAVANRIGISENALGCPSHTWHIRSAPCAQCALLYELAFADRSIAPMEALSVAAAPSIDSDFHNPTADSFGWGKYLHAKACARIRLYRNAVRMLIGAADVIVLWFS